jgi:uncharacterized protein
MAFLEKHLYLKRSKIPGAGMGLFTTVDIPRGTRIVEYKGRLVPWKDVKDQDGYNAYIFQINTRWAVDALPLKKTLGRYANDAYGLTRMAGLLNNSEYKVEGHKVYIDSFRNIKKGDEILVGYGKDYWSLIRKIMKEKGSL